MIWIILLLSPAVNCEKVNSKAGYGRSTILRV
jgi:hypothetical protein